MRSRYSVPLCIQIISCLPWVAALSFVLGCSEPELAEEPDPKVMLERFEKDRRHHDPQEFAEVDLGEFTVTLSHQESLFCVRFHLYAVVPDPLLEQFDELRVTHNERLRETVRGTTQRFASDDDDNQWDELNDPSLTWLKSDLTTAINQLLQVPIVKDVAFAEYTFEQG
jgi:hypothetical protein